MFLAIQHDGDQERPGLSGPADSATKGRTVSRPGGFFYFTGLY